METWESIILDAIKRYVDEEHSGDAKSAARAMGVKYETFRSWYLGVKSPNIGNLSPCMEKLGFQLPQVAKIRRIGAKAPIEEVRGNSLPEIPVLGSTGAGMPMEIFSLEPEAMIQVLPQYNIPGVVALRVEGDSMEPTVHKGSYVGIVPFNGEISEGGIYLVHIPPFGRTIKRVRISGSRGIILHSDNNSYEPIQLANEDYENTICGRVVWIWQLC